MWAKSFQVTLIRIEKEWEMKVKSPKSAIFDLIILKTYHAGRLHEGYLFTLESESESESVSGEHICMVEYTPVGIGVGIG